MEVESPKGTSLLTAMASSRLSTAMTAVTGVSGSGKSTLLKILARITAPTRGRVELWGRAGSLLEVGTGFHQELTGRENIFLNGAILGMNRAEIKSKFDEE
jgi:lipopolysaccharide transport system ATP-binding protein